MKKQSTLRQRIKMKNAAKRTRRNKIVEGRKKVEKKKTQAWYTRINRGQETASFKFR